MVTIYHKPNCATSRRVLQMIRAAGHEPVVVDYPKTGWSRDQLLALFAAAGLTPRQALRMRQSDAKALRDADADTIMAAMLVDPLLVERPFVSGPGGVRLCRPVELVHQVLAG